MRPNYNTKIILFYVPLLHSDPFTAHAEGCTVEGGLRLNGVHNYLQICRMNNWGYVCNSRFRPAVDGEIVLQQLNCNTTEGSYIYIQLIIYFDISIMYKYYSTLLFLLTSIAFASRNVAPQGVPVYRFKSPNPNCVGVERQLTECPRYTLSKVNNCNNKVFTVNCNHSGMSLQ